MFVFLSPLFDSEIWDLQGRFNGFWASNAPLPKDMVRRAANRVMDERRRKKKDEEMARWQKKARAQVGHGK